MKRLWGAILLLGALAVSGAENLKNWLDDQELWRKEDAAVQKKFAKSLVWRDGRKQSLYCPAKSLKEFVYGEYQVYDLTFEFKEKHLNAFSFAIFTRGDYKPPKEAPPKETGKKKKKNRSKKSSGKEEQKAMEKHFKTVIAAVKAECQARFKQEPESKQSRLSGSHKTMLTWKNKQLVLCFTIGTGEKNVPEYLSLRVSAPPPAPKEVKRSETDHTPPPPPPKPVENKVSKISREELRSRVQTVKGEHSLDLPMVDQGSKGYCVPATVLRVLHYYRIPLELHELARMLNTDPVKGTAIPDAVSTLKSIDGRLGVRYLALYEAEFLRELVAEDFILHYNQQAKRMNMPPMGGFAAPKLFYPIYHKMRANNGARETFFRKVRASVDAGIPLLWSVFCFEPKAMSLEKLNAPDPKAPPVKKEEKKSKKKADNVPRNVPPATGHLRLITGYRENPRGVIYSDSWGQGFEKEFMELDEAWTISVVLFQLIPNR